MVNETVIRRQERRRYFVFLCELLNLKYAVSKFKINNYTQKMLLAVTAEKKEES